MHKDYNNIEERLKDFQTFEHEVTDDVWSNLEGDLLLNNSISSFNDFEYDVDDSIWNGIEDKLKTTRPKPVIWWMPGIVASLLLLSLGAYNLDYISNIGSNQNEHSAVKSKKYNKNIVVNTSDNILNNNSNSEKNVKPEVEHISSDDINFNQSNVKNNLKTSENNFTASRFTSSNLNSSTENRGVEKLALIAIEAKQKDVINHNNITYSEELAVLGGNKINYKNLDNPIVNQQDIETNSEIEKLNDIAKSEIKIKDKNRKNAINSILNNNQDVKLDSLNDEEIIEQKELVNTNLPFEKEKRSESQDKKWKVIALGGIGNTRRIESSFDVVKPKKVKPLPVGLKSKTPQIIVEEEPINEGKVGLNYLSYSIPINLSFGVERKISKSTAIRVGLVYTKLNTEFEIYHEETHKLKIDYLAVPLTLVQTIKGWERVRVNSLALVRAEKLINSDHKLFDKDGLKYTNYSFANESKNILIGLGLEGEIDLLNNTSILTNIQVNKYLKIDSQQEYKRDKQDLWPEFNLGFSQKF